MGQYTRYQLMGAQSQKNAGRRSTGLAAQRNPGSGFDSCSQSRVSREEELSILTPSPSSPKGPPFQFFLFR
ncbi:hypothetical protein DSO57_1025604 [Entomophthora muscae]|uniref:Uncharacterized protein n=1 Tax=Entomophthora muscae TaxID=34485 RepID=A0ACC2SR75_9FUNG|nr:hypothetical protein DSO57_1025604 [Entomophthora muscae]